MKKHRNKLLIAGGVVAGAITGFAYWNYIGCASGSCAITSVWYNSTAYGAVMGGLVTSMLIPSKSKQDNSGKQQANNT